MTFIGYVQRRQGKFEKAVVTLKEASELDPRSARLAFNIGETFMLLRKYSEAERYYERAISLAPDLLRPYAYKVQLYLLAEGSTKKARAVLNRALENIGAEEDDVILFHWVLLEIFEGNYQKALDTLSMGLSEAFETQFYFVPKAQLYGQINGLMGNRQLEQAYYESARSILETKIQEQPEDGRFHSSLGIAYAGLGRKEDALREGKLGVKLLPVTKEAWRGLYRVEALAKIYVMVGEFDAAIDQLEYLLSIPSEMSIPLLRLDPAWDPLRDHPRFKRLLEGGK
jgi:serine/threonine-protein kinase